MTEARAQFVPEFECVAEARHFVRRVLGEWGLEHLQERAGLAVTELASNSVLHARTNFEVSLVFDGETLRVGVSDESPRAPTPKSHTPRATTGRGLSIVSGIASGWSVEPLTRGKTVWCTFDDARAQTPAGTVGTDETPGEGPPLRPVSDIRRRAQATSSERENPEDRHAASRRVA